MHGCILLQRVSHPTSTYVGYKWYLSSSNCVVDGHGIVGADGNDDDYGYQPGQENRGGSLVASKHLTRGLLGKRVQLMKSSKE